MGIEPMNQKGKSSQNILFDVYFSLEQVLCPVIEEAELMSYTAASHQGALHLWGAVLYLQSMAVPISWPCAWSLKTQEWERIDVSDQEIVL